VGDGDQVVFAADLFRLAAPASPADATRRAVDSAAPAPICGFLRPAPLLPHVRSFPRPAPLLPLVRAIRRRAPAILPQSASSSVSSLRPCAPLVDVQQVCIAVIQMDNWQGVNGLYTLAFWQVI
ncbi:unnamed protein product, partial [Urochloa humidicola]